MTIPLTKGELRVIADTDHVQCGDAAAMAKMLLEMLDSKPVAYMGDAGLHTLRKGWGIFAKPTPGQGHYVPLYIEPRPALTTMKDQQVRAFVNRLYDIATTFRNPRQLREHIARAVGAAMSDVKP